VRRRCNVARSSGDDLVPRQILLWLWRLGPAALEAWPHLAVALFMAPAMAAPAKTPQRQRLGIKLPDRSECDFALLRFLFRREPFVPLTAPSAFFLASFAHESFRLLKPAFATSLGAPSPRAAGRGKIDVVLAMPKHPSYTNATKAFASTKTKGRRSAGRRNVLEPRRAKARQRAAQARSPLGAPPRFLSWRPNAATQPRPRFTRARITGVTRTVTCA
jgi:hypothetical protein